LCCSYKVLIIVARSFFFVLFSSKDVCIHNVFRTFRCLQKLGVIGIFAILIYSYYREKNLFLQQSENIVFDKKKSQFMWCKIIYFVWTMCLFTMILTLLNQFSSYFSHHHSLIWIIVYNTMVNHFH
jgi:hypothetical protein